jgi:hypothetical protein
MAVAIDVWRERQLKASQPRCEKARSERRAHQQALSIRRISLSSCRPAPPFGSTISCQTLAPHNLLSSPSPPASNLCFFVNPRPTKASHLPLPVAAPLVRIPLSHLESAARLAMPRLVPCEMRSRLITPALCFSIRSLVPNNHSAHRGKNYRH